MLSSPCCRHSRTWLLRSRRIVSATSSPSTANNNKNKHCHHHYGRPFSTVMMDPPHATTVPTAPALPPLPNSSQPLGYPMPRDEHACSVSLPTWSAVVGYEEGNPTVTAAMLCGYPRFVYHPYVLQLMKHILSLHGTEKEDCLVLPSIYAARRCQIFLLRALFGRDEADSRFSLPDPASVARLPLEEVHARANDTSLESPIKVVSVNTGERAEVHAVLFPATTAAGTQAKAYWQHTGEIVSSRRAQACLQDMQVPLQKTVTQEQFTCHEHDTATDASDPDDAWTRLRQSIAGWSGTPAHHVVLTPSGMSAVYAALQSARRRHMEMHPERRGGRAIVYGFPYLDTLKLCSRDELCPDGAEFFGRADARDLASLEAYLEANPDEVSIVMTEVPSNPLLHCPDVVKLRELADKFNFLLVVDDTISNWLNVNLLQSGLADATVSSLTKLVSGRGDAIAGSVVCNPHTDGGRWMHQDLTNVYDGTHSELFCPDAMAILRNSQDFPERNAQINKTTEALADWLQGQDAVQRVYYPKMSHSVDLYHQVQHQPQSGEAPSGYGGLFSLVLAPHICERTFYDALDVAKGPSLGTNFTLVCPYTLLAHYHELDFAMSYDVPPNLLRIAVGLEPLEVLKEKFGTALKASQLYPKVCMVSVEQRKQQQPTKREFSTFATASYCGLRGNKSCACDNCSCCVSCRCGPSPGSTIRHNRMSSLRSWTPNRFASLRLS